MSNELHVILGTGPVGCWTARALTKGGLSVRAVNRSGQRPAVKAVSPLMMRLAGLFSPGAKESVEMTYEFTKPFVVDSSHIERELGLKATAVDDGLDQTVLWYKERGSA